MVADGEGRPMTAILFELREEQCYEAAKILRGADVLDFSGGVA